MYINDKKNSMKMVIWHHLPIGGEKYAIYYYVKGLVQRSHTVESRCPTTANQSYLPFSDLIREHVLQFPWENRPMKSFIGNVRSSIFDIVDKLKAMETH